jgi:hypothetical protein
LPRVAKGENLMQTWLRFAWFLHFCVISPLILSRVTAGRRTKPRSHSPRLCLICAFFCYPYPCLAWRRAKTSFRLGLTVLDFSHFLLFRCLGWRAWRGQNLVHTCLDFAWLLLFYCLRRPWLYAWRRAKTSFRLGLILLIFAILLPLGLGWQAWRGQDLVQN